MNPTKETYTVKHLNILTTVSKPTSDSAVKQDAANQDQSDHRSVICLIHGDIMVTILRPSVCCHNFVIFVRVMTL